MKLLTLSFCLLSITIQSSENSSKVITPIIGPGGFTNDLYKLTPEEYERIHMTPRPLTKGEQLQKSLKAFICCMCPSSYDDMD